MCPRTRVRWPTLATMTAPVAGPQGATRTRALLALALLVSVLAAWLDWRADPRGLVRETFSKPGQQGQVVDRRTVPGFDDYATRGPGLPTELFSMRWAGYWDAPPGRYEISLGADDAAVLELQAPDGTVTRLATRGLAYEQFPVVLGEGPHLLRLTFEQFHGASALKVAAARSGQPPMPLARSGLYLDPPTTGARAIARAADGTPLLAVLLWMAWLASVAWERAQRFARETAVASPGWPALQAYASTRWSAAMASRAPRVAVAVALLAIVAVGAVLRLDALSARYGPLDTPAWAQRMDFAAHEVSGHVKTSKVRFTHVDQPYVGSDALNYIKYAREMTSFYQAHVREPVFLAVTRAWLTVLDDADIAVSFASVTFSILLVPATYLLARAAFGPVAGLIASLLMAVEIVAISWGTEGMRDDASAAFVALTGWALLRLVAAPSRGVAVAGGVFGAAATLTRITSAGLWLPGLVLAVLAGPRATRGQRLRLAALNLAVGAALVSPYLYNCWKAFGDPLYSINYHTVFYRARENVAFDRPQSARAYVAGKLAQSPVQTIDTALYGLTAFPFVTKWTGFSPWAHGLGGVLMAASLAGLFGAVGRREGRLLLALLVLALLPFAVTWNVPGGGEWRFTLPAYPFYLAASGFAITGLVALVRAAVTSGPRAALRDWWVRHDRRWLAAAAAGAGVVAFAIVAMPWLSMREAVAHRTTVSILPAERSDVALWSGWDVLPRGGCARAVGPVQRLRLPLAGDGPWRLDIHLVSEQPPSAAPAPVEISVPSAVRLTTVTLRPDDRNQWARVEVPRRDGFLTDVVLKAFHDGTPAASGSAAPEYSICRVDIVPAAGD